MIRIINLPSLALLILLVLGVQTYAGSSDCVKVPAQPDGPLIQFTIGFNESDRRFVYVECILNRALYRIGYRSKLLAAPVGRELFDVVEGRADAVAATTTHELWSVQVDNLIRLEDPLVNVTNVVFTRKGVPTPASWQALAASDLHIVMARHHTSAQRYLAKSHTMDVEGVDQAVQVFLAGRAEALVTFESNREIRNWPEIKAANLNPPAELSVSKLYTYINDKYEALVPSMNAALQAEVTAYPWNVNE